MIAAQRRGGIDLGRILRGQQVVGHGDGWQKDNCYERQGDQLRTAAGLRRGSMPKPQSCKTDHQCQPYEIEGELHPNMILRPLLDVRRRKEFMASAGCQGPFHPARSSPPIPGSQLGESTQLRGSHCSAYGFMCQAPVVQFLARTGAQFGKLN